MNKCKYCTVDFQETESMYNEWYYFDSQDVNVHCKGLRFGKPIANGWGRIDITNSRLLFADCEYGMVGVDIVACPFCGRKLGADTNDS